MNAMLKFHSIWHGAFLGVKQGVNKIIFGNDTKLTVESRKFQIHFFKLQYLEGIELKPHSFQTSKHFIV